MKSSAELYATDVRHEFLVNAVLVKGQPGIIGGRSKVMKTSLAIDLALSLGSATPFLGRFKTPRQVKVAFWTGESGGATVRETAIRICERKGIRLEEVSVEWSFELPKLSRADHLAALENVIRKQGFEVAFIDPLYLSLIGAETAGSAGNLYAMGAALEPLSRIGQATGCTIVALHHFRKSGIPDPDNPAALEELSQSGAAEWARQWILIQRRTPYASDGNHELWMRAGGSAGHGSLHAVTINEGLLDPDTGEGRHWQVSVTNRAQAVADDRTRKLEAKQAAQEAKEAMTGEAVLRILAARPDGETRRQLRVAVGCNETTIAAVLDDLLKSGLVEGCKVRKHTREEDGYRLSKHPAV